MITMMTIRKENDEINVVAHDNMQRLIINEIMSWPYDIEIQGEFWAGEFVITKLVSFNGNSKFDDNILRVLQTKWQRIKTMDDKLKCPNCSQFPCQCEDKLRSDKNIDLPLTLFPEEYQLKIAENLTLLSTDVTTKLLEAAKSDKVKQALYKHTDKNSLLNTQIDKDSLTNTIYILQNKNVCDYVLRKLYNIIKDKEEYRNEILRVILHPAARYVILKDIMKNVKLTTSEKVALFFAKELMQKERDAINEEIISEYKKDLYVVAENINFEQLS